MEAGFCTLPSLAGTPSCAPKISRLVLAWPNAQRPGSENRFGGVIHRVTQIAADKFLFGMNVSDGSDQLGAEVDLAQKSSRSGAERLMQKKYVVVVGNEENLGLGRNSLDQRGGQQPIQLWKTDIEQNDAGSVLLGFTNRFVTSRGLADDIKVWLCDQQIANAPPHDFVVIHNEDAD